MLRHGEHETFKGSVHALMGGLALVCAVYNGLCYQKRRQRHSWVNASLYVALATWECVHVDHHWRLR